LRKIIHVDMDAFYASVEQRDDPELRGKPVIVAWKGNRSVVCAASYEARAFGVRSAMPAVRAQRLCPDGIFVPPDFPRYRAVSKNVHEIFKCHTDLIEPLSLDEAYLDVTENKAGLPTATVVARTIREQIRRELHLTASAGVAPNKFLAKLASDWRKPDGLFVIQPEEVDAFLLPLPVGRLPGVGKVTEEKLASLAIKTVGELRYLELSALKDNLGAMECACTNSPAVSTRIQLFRIDRRGRFRSRTRSSMTCRSQKLNPLSGALRKSSGPLRGKSRGSLARWSSS
jgi:DNA polymerase-4